LGDEKKILRRAALAENGNGYQVSFFTTPAFFNPNSAIEKKRVF
jgi:hypothetical protein